MEIACLDNALSLRKVNIVSYFTHWRHLASHYQAATSKVACTGRRRHSLCRCILTLERLGEIERQFQQELGREFESRLCD